VSVGIDRLGTAGTFALATALALVAQAAAVAIKRRREQLRADELVETTLPPSRRRGLDV
jgi:hypothetical protein